MENISKDLSIDGKPLRVHGVSTGMVAVKQKYKDAHFRGLAGIISFFLDKQFTEWLPIWVWVIEHPAGTFLVDTGENSRVSQADYFKSSGWFAHWLNTTQFKFKVEREDEIDVKLKELGLSPGQIDKVILTHLHLDHIDGLSYFEGKKILVNKREWEKPFGDLPRLYPSWFDPQKISLDDEFPPFKRARFLSPAKDLILVETSGHTHGHCSLLLKTDQGYLLFAGDVVYEQEQLKANRYSGGNVSRKKSEKSYQMIEAFAQHNKLVFLPSHDLHAGKRLREMEALEV